MSMIIDTNVLLLLVGGVCLREKLTSLKRLQDDSYAAFELLLEYMVAESAYPLIVPPHVLAETPSLMIQGSIGTRREELRRTLAALAAHFDERSIPASIAATRPEYARLGLTDAVLLCLARTGAPLLTKDGALYRAATTAGYAAFNFNHLIGNH